tara:strand:- start:333 stop:503 length:171 start_codon:yes stop_codon:yes gene_type:complete
MIECKICNKQYKQIDSVHLISYEITKQYSDAQQENKNGYDLVRICESKSNEILEIK